MTSSLKRKQERTVKLFKNCIKANIAHVERAAKHRIELDGVSRRTKQTRYSRQTDVRDAFAFFHMSSVLVIMLL